MNKMAVLSVFGGGIKNPSFDQRFCRRHRWFQVSLRMLLFLTLLVGVAFGWLGIATQRARDQRQAVLAIGALGGRIRYHEPTNAIQRSESLRAIIGVDFLLNIVEISGTEGDFRPKQYQTHRLPWRRLPGWRQ